MIDVILYFFFKITRKILLRLPLSFCLLLGKITGFFLFCHPRVRKGVFRNIKMAFPEKPFSEVNDIVRKFFENYGITLLALFIVPRTLNKITAENREILNNKGGVFVGIHEGMWEVFNFFAAMQTPVHGAPYAVLARKQPEKIISAILDGLRKQQKVEVYFSLKKIVHCIKNNYFLAMIIDQGVGKGAVFCDFFSHTVPVPTGAVTLARKFGKNIYPCFGYRTKGFNYTIEINTLSDVDKKTDQELLQEMNALYEKYLRKYPWEYFWTFKRFRYKRNRDLLIFADGDDLGLQYSLRLVELLRKSEYTIRHKIIYPQYRNDFSRRICKLVVSRKRNKCYGCSRCLYWFFEHACAGKLEKKSTDIIISTGNYLAPLNLMYARSIAAKSLVIFDPKMALKHFDFVLLPRYHKKQAVKNVVSFKHSTFFTDDKDIDQGYLEKILQ